MAEIGRQGSTLRPWLQRRGISKVGNARVRKTMGQLARLWLRNQPDSALSV